MKGFYQDIKHMGWLFKQMIKLGLQGNWAESLEAWYWIKIHWKYEGKRINR